MGNSSQGIEVDVIHALRDEGVNTITFKPDPRRGGEYVLAAKHTRTVTRSTPEPPREASMDLSTRLTELPSAQVDDTQIAKERAMVSNSGAAVAPASPVSVRHRQSR